MTLDDLIDNHHRKQQERVSAILTTLHKHFECCTNGSCRKCKSIDTNQPEGK